MHEGGIRAHASGAVARQSLGRSVRRPFPRQPRTTVNADLSCPGATALAPFLSTVGQRDGLQFSLIRVSLDRRRFRG